MNADCPRFEALSLAASDGIGSELDSHLRSCAPCAATMRRIERLAAAARELPWVDSSPERVGAMEASLLAQAAVVRQRPSRRWGVAAAGIALAAAIAWFVIGMGLLGGAAKPRVLSEIAAAPGARYEHVTLHPQHEGEPSAEIVRLSHGSVSLHVEHLTPGERFIVATADAEVEVRGTRFEVLVDEGKLVRVAVTEGKVEVRVAGQEPLLLHPGESWERPVPEAAPLAGAVAAVAPVAAAEPVAAPSPADLVPHEAPSRVRGSRREAPEGERAFASAWSALRGGDAAGAAAGFERVASLAGGEVLAEDADYWRIVALARAGASTESEAAMESFLRSHRDADRSGEVALMLGLRHLARGDRDAALPLLEQASRDSVAAVRERAVEALGRLRQ